MKHDIRRMALAAVIPLFLLFILYILKFLETGMDWNFTRLGVYPMEQRGVFGIFAHPLVHSSFKHLFAKSGMYAFSNTSAGLKLSYPSSYRTRYPFFVLSASTIFVPMYFCIFLLLSVPIGFGLSARSKRDRKFRPCVQRSVRVSACLACAYVCLSVPFAI